MWFSDQDSQVIERGKNQSVVEDGEEFGLSFHLSVQTDHRSPITYVVLQSAL